MPELNYRALVVDDNADHALTLKALVEALGFQAQAVTDSREAEAAALRMRPKIVFLDIGMPHLDGWQVAERLRQHFDRDRLRIIALTGYSTSNDRAKSLRCGFDQHVCKPMELQTLQDILSGVK